MRAFDMWLNLTNFFKEDMEGKNKDNEFLGWFYGPRFGSNEKKAALLIEAPQAADRRYDPPSNTVMVANASASQTAEVEQLIKEYDKPARSDSVENGDDANQNQLLSADDHRGSSERSVPRFAQL